MSTNKLMLLASAAGIATAGFAGNTLAIAPPYYSWEVASEFNDQTNACIYSATSPWCYGSEPALLGVFTPYPLAINRGAGMLGWGPPATPPNSLAIVHNVNPFYFTDTGGVPHPAHSLDFLPGNNCEVSVLRFNVPYKGHYKISGQYYGLWLDNNGYENADVHIFQNNAAQFNGLIDMHNGPIHLSFTTRNVIAQKNDHIDFVVGCGTNGNNFYDHVGLNAVIERL